MNNVMKEKMGAVCGWMRRPQAQCIALTVGVLLFTLGTPVQIVLCVALFAATLCADLVSALGMYVFMFFMDDVTVAAFLGGSASRVMQVALLLRVLFVYGKTLRTEGKEALRRLKRSDVGLAAFALFAIGMGLIDHGLSADTASFAVNAGLFILLRPVVRARGAQTTLETLLRYYVRGALAAVLIGLVEGRFLATMLNENTQSCVRFKGTSEPNFMAAHLSIAVHMHLSLKQERSRIRDALMTGVLGCAILMTYSMTGILCFALATIALLIVHRDEMKKLLTRIGLALPVAALCFALVTGYVSLRGVEAFNHGVLGGNALEKIYHVTPEGYERMRHGATFEEVAILASDFMTPEERVITMKGEAAAMANEAQGSALLIRIQEAILRLKAGDYDALTSGRYGLLQMKMSDYALLPLWQKAFGTGPDAVITYQPLSWRINYSHNSYADMLYSTGFVGFAVIVLYIIHLQRRRMFAGERMTGDAARALLMGRTSLLVSAMVLSMHTSRTMLFFLIL